MHQCDERSYYLFNFNVLRQFYGYAKPSNPLKVINSNKYINKQKPKKYTKNEITYRSISHIYRFFMYNSLNIHTVSLKATYF